LGYAYVNYLNTNDGALLLSSFHFTCLTCAIKANVLLSNLTTLSSKDVLGNYLCCIQNTWF